jgi:hypothetical protein
VTSCCSRPWPPCLSTLYQYQQFLGLTLQCVFDKVVMLVH